MEKSQLDLAAEGLYEVMDQNPHKLPEVTRPIAYLYTFQAMVDNGGFRYPMENNLPGDPPYSVISDAYRAIGAKGAAEALDKAVSLFPFEKPELDADARNAYFDSLGDEDAFDQSEFQQLSNRVCGDVAVWQLMGEYVANHKQAFEPFIKQS